MRHHGASAGFTPLRGEGEGRMDMQAAMGQMRQRAESRRRGVGGPVQFLSAIIRRIMLRMCVCFPDLRNAHSM